MSIQIQRHWDMPSKDTFSIPSISKFINKIVMPKNGKIIIDPFSNRKHGFATEYNDIKGIKFGYSLDALDFLCIFDNGTVDGVLYDPPYSLRQLKECYDGVGKALSCDDSKNYFTKVKDEIARVLKPGGFCLSFGWNSGGIGKKRGFEIDKILIVNHGGVHHDTIVTYDIKKQGDLLKWC